MISFHTRLSLKVSGSTMGFPCTRGLYLGSRSYASGKSELPTRKVLAQSFIKRLEQEVYKDNEVMQEEQEELSLDAKLRSTVSETDDQADSDNYPRPRNQHHQNSNYRQDKQPSDLHRFNRRNGTNKLSAHRDSRSQRDTYREGGSERDKRATYTSSTSGNTTRNEPPRRSAPSPVTKPYPNFRVCDESTIKMGELNAQQLAYDGVPIPDAPLPPELKHNLDRVLFNPGVHFLKDPRTNVYNFTPYLENIMSVKDFDFTKIASYVPSGKDSKLAELAKLKGKRYVGSTSSLTGILSHLHRLLSHERLPHLMSTSKVFYKNTISFAPSQVSPTSVFLRYNKKLGIHAVDSDKTHNEDIIVSILGHLLESLLTTEPDIFETYRKNSNSSKASSENTPANAYHYTECGSFLMRSQLDCIDSRLPGTGVFDLKTRAVCAVRHDMDYAQIHDGSYYTINKLDGEFESFAREWFDLIRSSMFKYSLQARIGRMDGIMIAYHNIKQMFGFQYVPLEEMDKIFHTSHLLTAAKKQRLAGPEAGSGHSLESLDDKMNRCAPLIADAEFKLSVELMEQIFDKVVASYGNPEASFNVVFYKAATRLFVLAKPMTEEHINEIQTTSSDTPKQHYGHANKHLYKMREDPNTIATHANDNIRWLPLDVKVFEVTVRSYVNDEIVLFDEHPSLESETDEWKVQYVMKELPVANSNRVYSSVMDPENFPKNSTTTIPQLERLEEHLEAERTKEALKNMNPPNVRQTHLRKLSSKSQQKVLEELQSDAPKKIWFPKTVPKEVQL